MISPLPLMRFFTPKKFLGTLRPEYFGGGIFSVKVISIIDYYKRRSKAVKRTLINIAGKGNGREGMYRSNKISYATRASSIKHKNPSGIKTKRRKFYLILHFFPRIAVLRWKKGVV